LEDGFHAIPIHPDDRKYFTFSIGGKVFQFAALPFGWTLNPFVFAKVMRHRECPGGGMRKWRIQEM
jgi:hypothetical protein